MRNGTGVGLSQTLELLCSIITWLRLGLTLSSSAAADPRYSRRSLTAFDGEHRKKADYDHLVATALHKVSSRQKTHPTSPDEELAKVEVHNLTRSKRKLVVKEALEVGLGALTDSPFEFNALLGVLGGKLSLIDSPLQLQRYKGLV